MAYPTFADKYGQPPPAPAENQDPMVDANNNAPQQQINPWGQMAQEQQPATQQQQVSPWSYTGK